MHWLAKEDKILNFLHEQKLAVISTSSQSSIPESALVAFVEDERLCIYFQTGVHTRKAINLQSNPHASFVFGLTLDILITVQYEGVARQLIEPSDIDELKLRFIAKDSPTTKEYLERSSSIFFQVTPTWIRLSDYSKICPEVIEITEFL